MGIKENLEIVRKEIAASARKSGRNPEEIVLVGISKTFPLSSIRGAVESGLSDIGENRIQEAEAKFPMLPHVRKHFVGHLQGNKVKKAVEIADMIQSVDSLKTASKISEASMASNKVMPVLVEILTDKDKQFGVSSAELINFLEKASKFEGIRILGIMTVGPYFENSEDSRPAFKEMRRIFDSVARQKIPGIEMRYLSMGMSGDFRIAIEEGANMVRIGCGIFGERREQ